MTILLALLFAAVMGFIAYLICVIVPFLKPYANLIGILVFLVTLLNRLGVF